ncbi:phosphatidate cytidylyltransferase [Rufibacter quisquiliarum]|uniref:Phosphatidate cytidylyltransferase n=1 Tax=Rufibacter quisquiliarum TaxID=1549639 RepID=A0A839GI08_9BACT|nr:phosphatidate cytidylyltransferase [Rufibacter quisquiliarum]MBA9078512.1 phosphatidate cytidylyltransferase [Rufibacter quisquiliarum]
MEQPQPKKELNNLQLRLLAGIIGGAVFIGAIFWSAWTFFLLFLVLTVLGLLEFYRLLAGKGYQPNKALGVLLGLELYVMFFWVKYGGLDPQWLYLLLPLMAFTLVAELYRKKEHPFENIAFTLLGVLYIAVPFALLHVLAFWPERYSWQIILGVMFLIWASDTGAYAAGKTFGKHKLFPRISPGKTWEGWAGGVVLSLVVGWVLSLVYFDLSLELWLGMAVLVAVFGVLGDLVESMLKRNLGVKDSGTLIPGHGGILDRFDSLILVVPFLVAFLELTHL